MKVCEVPLTLTKHDSDIKIKACTQKPQSFVTPFCAYDLLKYQVRVYRTIGPLVYTLKRVSHYVSRIYQPYGSLQWQQPPVKYFLHSSSYNLI